MLPTCSSQKEVFERSRRAGEEEEVGARGGPTSPQQPPNVDTSQSGPDRHTLHMSPHRLPPSGCCQFDQVEHLSVGRGKSVKPGLKSGAILSAVNDARLLVRKPPGDESAG